MEALLVTHLEKRSLSPALMVWVYVFFRVLSIQNRLRMHKIQVLTESEHPSSVFACVSGCMHVSDVCVNTLMCTVCACVWGQRFKAEVWPCPQLLSIFFTEAGSLSHQHL